MLAADHIRDNPLKNRVLRIREVAGLVLLVVLPRGFAYGTDVDLVPAARLRIQERAGRDPVSWIV